MCLSFDTAPSLIVYKVTDCLENISNGYLPSLGLV